MAITIADLYKEHVEMNGHFEVDNSSYPISQLKSGDGFKVTDMRTLKALHSQPIPRDAAERISKNANAYLRDCASTGHEANVAMYVAGALGGSEGA